MNCKLKAIALMTALCAAPAALPAQDLSSITNFTVDDKPVQIHGFVQQGFAYSNQNNFLTMDTSKGSFAMFDAGFNISTALTDNLRVGAQAYDRYLGKLDTGQLQLDWAMADYKFKPWLGIRVGKVKTVLGLYNDTQDMEFLHTFALMPQGMYPTDQRSSQIAHLGGDLYGDIPMKRFGTLSYTIYGGQRPNAPHEGFEYAMKGLGIFLQNWEGSMEGGDLKWTTPVPGLLLGMSAMGQDENGAGQCYAICFSAYGGAAWEVQHVKHDETTQYYLSYTKGNLEIDAEYRRRYRALENTDFVIDGPTIGPYYVASDTRSWYGSATYRLNKRISFGGYYSWYYANWRADLSLPDEHIYDRDLTLRYDLSSHWSVKVEGHFMNGYGELDAARGFYPQENRGTTPTATGGPNLLNTGLVPVTNLLVVRTAWNF